MKKIRIIFIVFIVIVLLGISVYAIFLLNKKEGSNRIKIYISKEEIEKKQQKIEKMAQTDEEYKNKDAVQELTKEKIELEEANSANIDVKEEQKKKFKSDAEKEYESKNDSSINREEYVNKVMNDTINMEKRNLYYADVMIRISTKTLECDSKTVNSKLKKYYENPSVEQLEKAYDEYIKYLSKNKYEIIIEK